MSTPTLQQTLPGRSVPYRVFTREHLTYVEAKALTGTYNGQEKPASRVALPGWGTSYSHTYGEPGVTLNAYVVPVTMDSPGHPLDGSWYEAEEEAHLMAFDAGLIGFMVYEEENQS